MIAFRVGSVIFSATESVPEYLRIFRFFTIFEKKSFTVSAVSDSVFKNSPFSLTKILFLMYHLLERIAFTFSKTFCY